MAFSMNSNADAAKEREGKGTEQESVNIARIYSGKRVRIILTHCFQVISVVNGIGSLRLEINEQGQVSGTMVQFFFSHDDGFHRS